MFPFKLGSNKNISAPPCSRANLVELFKLLRAKREQRRKHKTGEHPGSASEVCRPATVHSFPELRSLGPFRMPSAHRAPAPRGWRHWNASAGPIQHLGASGSTTLLYITRGPEPRPERPPSSAPFLHPICKTRLFPECAAPEKPCHQSPAPTEGKGSAPSKARHCHTPQCNTVTACMREPTQRGSSWGLVPDLNQSRGSGVPGCKVSPPRGFPPPLQFPSTLAWHTWQGMAGSRPKGRLECRGQQPREKARLSPHPGWWLRQRQDPCPGSHAPTTGPCTASCQLDTKGNALSHL